MIWLISRDEVSIAVMARTARPTTSPERAASALALDTTVRACAALCDVCFTVAVISSSAAAVSSSEAACCSVRLDRSSAATEISAAPERSPAVLAATAPITSSSWSMVALKSARSASYRARKARSGGGRGFPRQVAEACRDGLHHGSLLIGDGRAGHLGADALPVGRPSGPRRPAPRAGAWRPRPPSAFPRRPPWPRSRPPVRGPRPWPRGRPRRCAEGCPTGVRGRSPPNGAGPK